MGVYLWKLRELESYTYYHLPRAYLKTQRKGEREKRERERGRGRGRGERERDRVTSSNIV